MESAIVILAALCAFALAFWRALAPERRVQIISFARNARAGVVSAQRAIAARANRKRSAYRALFLGPDGGLSPVGQIVFADLTAYCYGLSTTSAGAASEDTAKRREGRRQVLIHIMSMIGADLVSAHNAVQMEEMAVLG